MEKIFILSLGELGIVIHYIKEQLPKGGIILLKGDLASGKTTLVKTFVQSLGIVDEVTSPTFSIQNIYGNEIYHYDIYNNGVSKFIESGLLEALDEKGYHFIEWADEMLETILKEYGFEYMTIGISAAGQKRKYKCIS